MWTCISQRAGMRKALSASRTWPGGGEAGFAGSTERMRSPWRMTVRSGSLFPVATSITVTWLMENVFGGGVCAEAAPLKKGQSAKKPKVARRYICFVGRSRSVWCYSLAEGSCCGGGKAAESAIIADREEVSYA